MQKIFYNANILTFDEKQPNAEAMLVNDESIVLTGTNEEVLAMKTDDIKIINLEGKTILPSFFDVNTSLYKMIEENLKNANKQKKLENNAEIDLNYNEFKNFDAYKKEFLKIQDMCLSLGITTVLENNLSCKEFIFWKKLAEQKLLKIDVVGTIDILNFKSVMDDNCRSYRKYKNHFRLGGYALNIDGDIFSKRAWLKKPYRGEHGYKGYGEVTYEQLSFLIKTALEEKKQIVFAANGDAAIEMLLLAFNENAKEKEREDLFKPIVRSQYLKKQDLKNLKSAGISPCFNVRSLSSLSKQSKKALSKMLPNILPACHAKKMGIDYLLCGNELEVKDVFSIASFASERKDENGKVVCGKQKIPFEDAVSAIIKTSATLLFDDAHKGSLENGKLANFVVLDGNSFEEKSVKVLETYVDGEREFKLKEK